MKKIFTVISLSFLCTIVKADEGMWLPMLLGQDTYNEMVKKGLKLSKEQIFSLNKKSIKDAIFSFGGICTGQVVSDKGLILTNYTCGYEQIAELSTVEKNYLKNGFFASSMAAEMPVKGLYANFLTEIKDVTQEITDQLGDLQGGDRSKKLTEIFSTINKKYSNPEKSVIGRVTSFFRGNQYILFVYEQFTDIRYVGSPSESFGKFGGDTENWEWPRHTNNFSVWRIYSGADNTPAKYNVSNKPFKPKYFFPISLAPKKEGDFNMIIGYPAATNRYEVSYGAKMSRDISDPSYVKMRAIRLKAMKYEMDKSPATRLKLAAGYADLANYWKFYDLEGKLLYTRKVVEKKESQEAIFSKWSTGKKDYDNLLKEYEQNYNAFAPYEKLRNYMQQGIYGSVVVQVGVQLANFANLMNDNKAEEAKKIIENLDKNRKNIMNGFDLNADQSIISQIAFVFYTDIDKSQHPAGIYDKIAKFGDLKVIQTYEKYTDVVFAKSIFLKDDAWAAFVANPTSAAVAADLSVEYSKAFSDNWNKNYVPKYNAFQFKNNDLSRLWIRAQMAMNPNRTLYPDGNSTMRITYGSIQSYTPRDAVKYDYISTASGLLEKYKPNDEEFDLPTKAITLIQQKDFGRYMDPERRDLVTCFLSNCDITGGNSGSAVLNGKGELIGLIFDGNSESMDQKLNYYQTLTRCIGVDIRYILWNIEKVGNAKHIVDELTINK
jgi:hypothetical protein